MILQIQSSNRINIKMNEINVQPISSDPRFQKVLNDSGITLESLSSSSLPHDPITWYSRNGNGTFSHDEKKTMIDMKANGKSYGDIAKAVGSSADAVWKHLKYTESTQITKRGPWSEEESKSLLEHVHGNTLDNGIYETIAIKLGRSAKGCRERYNILQATSRPWSIDEDSIITKETSLGNYSWSKIAQKLSAGRTDQQVKRRKSTLDKQVKKARKMSTKNAAIAEKKAVKAMKK